MACACGMNGWNDGSRDRQQQAECAFSSAAVTFSHKGNTAEIKITSIDTINSDLAS